MSGPETRRGDLYGDDLARLHHEHFGMVAEGAAAELLARLAARGVTSGTVVDLAAGSGILSRRAVEAGFDVLGVDVSAPMLRLARQHAPGARFVRGSLWEAALPACVAVAAVGEALCYVAGDDAPSLARLEARLRTIAAGLAPGGLLLFDVSCPGRSGPEGRRQVRWDHGDAALTMAEVEDRGASRLTRTIETRVATPAGERRAVEEHVLHLYEPDAVAAALDATGFTVGRLDAYGTFRFLPGWTGFAATRR